jgi:hypothetical protein
VAGAACKARAQKKSCIETFLATDDIAGADQHHHPDTSSSAEISADNVYQQGGDVQV